MTFEFAFNMIQQLLLTFPPMLFGAQALLTLLLIKGDICPGQRGRLHKMLPSIGILWLAVASYVKRLWSCSRSSLLSNSD